MSDGLILLITGAMLTGGLAASLLAGRLRVPGLVLVLGLGMAIGSEGLGLDLVQRLHPRPPDRDRRAVADPVRGRARGRVGRHPPRVRRGAQPGRRRDGRDRGDRRPRRGGAVPSVDDRGPAAGLDSRLDRRRRGVRGAARLDAAKTACPNARRRGRPQRPRGGRARDRLHRLGDAQQLRPRRPPRPVRAPVRNRRRDRRGGRGERPCSRFVMRGCRPPVCIRSRRSRSARWPTEGPTSCTGRGSWPCT